MPAKKTPAVRSLSKKSIKSNQFKNRLSVRRKKGLGLHLCDLPTEILERIIRNIHIWHRNRIRATCKRLRNVCDSALMHEFKLSLQKYGRRSKSCHEYASLTVIHQSTWAYVKAGYCPLFLGTMLPLMRDNYSNPFSPTVEKIRQFLVKFYKLVEENLRDPYSQTSRLLYAVTLLGFMHKCKNSTLMSSVNIRPDYWHAVFEFQGSWLGMLHCSRPSHSFSYSSDRNELLILLAEIMISVNSETAFKKVWEAESQIFVFGHDMSQRTHLPRTIFTFDVYGTTQILSFLKNAASRSNWKSLPKDDFNLRLNILCKEASKWGCYPSYQLEISSDSEAEQVKDDNKEVFIQNIKIFT